MRFLVPVVLVLVVAVLVRATLFSSLPSRRARWRIRFRFKPAPGFAWSTPALVEAQLCG